MIEIIIQISKNGIVCASNGLVPWVFPKVIDRIFKEDIGDKNIIKGRLTNWSYDGNNKVLTLSRRKKNLNKILKEGGVVIGGYNTFHTFYPHASKVIYYVVNNVLGKGEKFFPYLNDVSVKMSKDYIEDVDLVSKKEFYIARIEHVKNI